MLLDVELWGDVATWVTGVFTAGPLFIALYILWRDSKRERVRQAKSVVFVVTSDYDLHSDATAYRVQVWNYSERPILRLSFLWFYDSWKAPVGVGEILEGPGEQLKEVLHPREEAIFTHTQPLNQAFGFWGISFTDVDRQMWMLNLKTDQLEHYDVFLKWLTAESRRRNKARSRQPRGHGG